MRKNSKDLTSRQLASILAFIYESDTSDTSRNVSESFLEKTINYIDNNTKSTRRILDVSGAIQQLGDLPDEESQHILAMLD